MYLPMILPLGSKSAKQITLLVSWCLLAFKIMSRSGRILKGISFQHVCLQSSVTRYLSVKSLHSRCILSDRKKESTKREKNDSHLCLQWKILYIMIIWPSSYIQHVKQTRETFISTHSLGIFFRLMKRLGYENRHCFFSFLFTLKESLLCHLLLEYLFDPWVMG